MTAKAVMAKSSDGSPGAKGSMQRWGSRLAWVPLLTVVLAIVAWMDIDVLGYRPLVVMSGSMRPALQPGDIAVVEVIPAHEARLGDVVSFRDPSRAQVLVTHRVVAAHEAGAQISFITQGDANTAGEQWTIEAGGSIGRLAVRIPLVGRLVLIPGRPGVRMALVAGALLVLAAGGLRWLGLRRGAAVPGPALIALVTGLGLVVGFAVPRTLGAFSSATSNGPSTFEAAASFCSSPGTVTVYASGDAWIDQANPTQNNGTGVRLFTRTLAGKNKRSLVAFSLPPRNGCSVTAATLRMYQDPPPVARVLEARMIASSWTEGGVTWASQPATAGDPVTTTSALGWNSWNVTSMVQAMYGGASYGFLVRHQQEDHNEAEQRFRSREQTEKPELVITLG